MLNYVSDRQDVRSPDGEISSEFEEMAVTLLMLAKRIRVLFGLALAEAGYHNGQDQLLTCLIPGEALAVSALASTLDVRASTISKMLDRLTNKGLVERRQLGRDKRVTLVCLTPAGEDAQEEIRNLWANVCRQMAAGLNGDFGDTMLHLQNVSDVLAARLMKLRWTYRKKIRCWTERTTGVSGWNWRPLRKGSPSLPTNLRPSA